MSSSGGAPLFVMAFDNTLGAILIGGVLAMALWGVTCVQTYTYFTQKSRDPPIFRLLMAFLFALDTFDSSLCCHMMYYYLVINFTNPLAMLNNVWSVVIHVASTCVCNFIIRSMFARRIYRLSEGNYILTLWVVLISLTDLTLGLYITARAFNLSSFLELKNISTFLYLNFAATTTSDLSVALALCYLLHRTRTGFERSDSLIKVLMMYTVNNGLIIGVDATAGMIAYITMPDNFIFLAFYMLQSKLYLNAYLATLNARESLQDLPPLSLNLSSLSQSRNRYTHEHSQPTTMEMGSRVDMMATSDSSTIDQKYYEDHMPRAL